MPELPEVEVTRRLIGGLLIGRVIARVRTTQPSYLFLTPPDRLASGLRGRTVSALVRHGKYLLAELDDGRRLLVHLGMTGQLFSELATSVRLLSATARAALTPEQQVRFRRDEHTHLTLEFADGGPAVMLRDVRKFGKLRLLEPGASDPRLDRLGVDALAATGRDIQQAARSRGTPIKTLLLNQAVLAGVGNIYADEALFLARLRPTRPARGISKPACDRLAAAVRRVLERAIETGGSSVRDYVSPDGSDGGYQDERHVYARTGEPCGACAEPIRRVVIGQRSTHFCPRCQK